MGKNLKTAFTLTHTEIQILGFIFISFILGDLLALYKKYNTEPLIISSSSPISQSVSKKNKVDINQASLDELISLPVLGETLAKRIIEERTKVGKFNTLEELLKIDGIGKKKLEKLKPYLVLE